ncbi:MAG: PAS domain-containing sensor histidine kinase [Deltaproteobacteria bacterium]|nr:PAS domain-containing sensor histidine kinase [Deltaproteobacteria bacterium]
MPSEWPPRSSLPSDPGADAALHPDPDFNSLPELLRAVFDCASYGIYYATRQGIIQLCNDAFVRLTGLRREELVGKPYHRLTTPEFVDEEQQAVAHVLSSGLPSEFDKDLAREDGFRIPVRVSVAPLRNRSGTIVGTISIVRDTVAEQESARALKESEERYRAAFRNNPDAIFVVERDGLIVDANPAATTLTGLPREQLLKQPLIDLVPETEVASQRDSGVDLQRTGETYRPQARFSKVDGGEVTTEVHGTALGQDLWQVLARDITARVEAESKLLALKELLEERVAARTRELEEANAALAHASKMKDQFLANMSHELRTPLNSILGLSDALLEGVYGALDESQQPIVATMRDSGKHLLELINDILDLSKIDAGRLELDYRSISVSEVCQASLRMIRPLAVAKRIGTWMRTDPKFQVVVADERRLKQMLVNLLSNAVKFTPSGGTAGVEAWAQGDEAYFSITDTGIGISAVDVCRIFEPFTQIDSSLARQHEGTGLGLALVRRLAELHNGRVDVDSEPGRGSRFTIVLPRCAPPERDSIPTPEGAP